IPAGYDSLNIKVYTNTAGSDNGNDFVFDDLELRLCVSPVVNARANGKATDTICAGNKVELTVDQYDDQGVFVPAGSNLKGYWIRSSTGDLSKPSEWTILASSTVTGQSPLTIPSYEDYPPANDTLYYQFVIAGEHEVDRPTCRASSKVIPVVVLDHAIKYPDIRLQLCTGLTGTIHLSSYLDTANFQSVNWIAPSGSPAFALGTNSTSGELNVAQFTLGTHIYRYEIQNKCGNGDGRVYIKYTSTPVVPSMIDTIVVCRSISSASSLQMNQIIGLEANGTLNYATNISSYVTAVSAPSQFAGAYIFDAAKAWSKVQDGTLPASYKITYNGDTQAAFFTFTYNTSSQSCFGNKTRVIVILVTSRPLPLH
ncbi:MAG: hypothetical protein LBC98_01615, partial [Prevotellaceae bacterium]|nr:hypothetical protein [Prevotellaceae bacterium]